MSAPLANRLAGSRSLYLRDAAHSPVAWQPWGDEAFALARALDRPLLLDIGASWCHWCHVMDDESYENDEIAAILNLEFVAIKVDRDERPDVDARYQAAVGAITGTGGWPLTAFLTADGDVFYGGTYFPPDDRPGTAGLKSLLPRIALTYRNNREQVQRSAAGLLAALRERQAVTPAAQRADAAAACVEAVLDSLRREYDEVHGGFGREPKFLHAAAIELVLAAGWRRRDATLTDIATRTLARVSRSGLIDQLGGGFHRYTVDREWRVPHFEKLLADQAEALQALSLVASADHCAAADATVRYLFEQLRDERGPWFAASQDADSPGGHEGDYYTWTEREIDEALPPQAAALFKRRYGIRPRGDIRHDPRRNVPIPTAGFDELAAATGLTVDDARAACSAADSAIRHRRVLRPAPRIDRTCFVGPNAHAASALFAFGARCDRDDAITAASRLVDFLRRTSFAGDGLAAHAIDPAAGPEGAPAGEDTRFLDDQLRLTLALLDAFEHTGDAGYLREGCALLEVTLRVFGESGEPAGTGGLRDRHTRADDAADGMRAMPWRIALDHAGAAGNALAIVALDRAAALASRPSFREAATRIAETFAGVVAGHGRFAASFAHALLRRSIPSLHIVIAGDPGDAWTKRLHREALAGDHPARAICLVQVPVPETAFIPEIARAVVSAHRAEMRAAAYVCQDCVCSRPLHDPAGLREHIAARRG